MKKEVNFRLEVTLRVKREHIVATRVLKAGTYYVVYLQAFGGVEGYDGYDLTMRIERFTDVPATHMYYEQIEALAQLGINKGYMMARSIPMKQLNENMFLSF